MENKPILCTRALSFSYDGQAKALDSVSVEIPTGKKTVFLGPNGSGKSTLFLHFNGVHRPDSGEVLFGGQAVKHDAKSLASLRSQVSLVFQNPDDQIFSATVEEDVAFGPLNSGVERAEAGRRVDEVLSLVGLGEMRERPTQQLSFGQRKRVALAGALAMRPKVLIMDEPTAGLDPEMVHELLELSDELNHRGVTVVLSTHDVETAYEWADEVRLLHRGQLIYSGGPDEFFSRPDIHDFGLAPPMAFLLNQQMHWRTGKAEKPHPRSFAELAAKCFPISHKKPGTLRLVCVNPDAKKTSALGSSAGSSSLPAPQDPSFNPARASPPAPPAHDAPQPKHSRESPAHLHSGIYGSLARKLAAEGKLDAHYRFHALEHGLLHASLGEDFILYTDADLCSLVEARAKRLEDRTGLRIGIEHSHP
ncbi:MAG: energy-coupling factor ABC transporter ATP-binding protein [Candidatus Micrarchaeota archaeon]